MRWKQILTAMLVASTVIVACSSDPTTSVEYEALAKDLDATKAELVARDAALASTEAELAAALEEVEEAASTDDPATDIPAGVEALMDEWWAANERADGSVADLYRIGGYHVYGAQRIGLDDLASHLNTPGYSAEWITEPYLLANEPEGRYVVVRGIRTTSGSSSYASVLTFEIMTMPDGDLKIAQTDFVYVNS